MTDNHKYYKALKTTDLIELLVEVTNKYIFSPVGESDQTVSSYRELLEFLHREIQQRILTDRGALPPDTETILSINA